MKRVVTATALTAATVAAFAAPKSERPNIVWYLTEDLSPQYLAIYNEGRGAATPVLESLADQSIIYTNALCNAPVSSAARTTLITGCYAPRFGGSFHRNITKKPMPDGLRMFPSYLRESGYYTCNAKKTDYNVVLDKTAWDEIEGDLGGWRNREQPDQPFFYVRSTMTTHESKLIFNETKYKKVKTRTPLDSVYLHPNLPDTKLVRYTYATLYDRIEESDREVGELIEMLREDDLLDNTIILFMGDNGGSMPESKGYTDDVGFRVPIIAIIPEQWREELGAEVGRREGGFVSFMDMGATTLNIAGVEIPDGMDGVPFIGKGSSTHESVICYGDRFDDLYAFNRALYRDNFRYARNYQPHHTQGQHTFYRYKSLTLQEVRDMFYSGDLDPHQSRFFEPFGAEELYDLSADPNETRNLVDDPAYRDRLESMREELAAKVEEYCDLGFLPENVIIEEAINSPTNYGAAHKAEIARYREIADMQLIPYSEARSEIYKAISSTNAVEKWWALTTAAAHGDSATRDKRLIKATQKIANSDSSRSYLKMRAEVFIAHATGEKLTADRFKNILSSCQNEAEVTLILNDATHLKESGLLENVSLTKTDTPYSSINITPRLKHLSQ